MHYLSVIAIFKNEGHCIAQWIQHYINEGVDHFYLIDNGSTDDYKSKIAPFVEQGLITLVVDDTKWAQSDLYNKYFLNFKEVNNWFLICDLDEFVYARKGFKTIQNYLKTLPKNVGMVQIPWKMFGSSGFEKQPNQILPSFTKRSLYDCRQNEGMNDRKKGLVKSVVNVKYLKKFDVHRSYIKRIGVRLRGDGKRNWNFPGSFGKVSEQILENSFLHLNHYPIQSLDWFLKIKVGRGCAASKNTEFVKDINYFHRYDSKSNIVEDRELAEKEY